MKKTAKATENGKSVFQSGVTGRPNKGKVSTSKVETANSATSVNETSDYKIRIYEDLAKIELTPLKLSVNLSDFEGKSEKEIISYISEIRAKNQDIEKTNFSVLLQNLARIYRHFVFATVDEREQAKKEIRKVWDATDKFKVTFNPESGEFIYNEGAYYGRKTRATASGIRTAFNSYSVIRSSVSRLAKIEKAKQAREKLANLSAEEILQMLGASALAQLAEKVK